MLFAFLLRRRLGTVALKKLEGNTSTHRYDLRSLPITVEQSVRCGQMTVGIEGIEGGEHGANITVMDAGVLH